MYAFQNCGALEQVTISEGTEKIGAYAFSMCVKLRVVNLPTSMEKVEANAFWGCRDLAEVVLHERTQVDQEAFVGCGHVTMILRT